MCSGNLNKDNEKQGADAPPSPDNQHDYSHIFTEIESQMIIHRALMMQRLVHDPFYRLMNITDPARNWMLRHLAPLAEQADLRYNTSLLQFFELMGRDEVLEFFRYKNAPPEITNMWKKLYPDKADEKKDDPGNDSSGKNQVV